MSNGPYQTISELPNTIKDILPEEGQRIYLETYQRSWETYEESQGGEMGQEAVAHRDGWNAVKRDYVKDEKSAQWYKKGEKPEEEEKADSGLVDTIKSAFVKE